MIRGARRYPNSISIAHVQEKTKIPMGIHRPTVFSSFLLAPNPKTIIPSNLRLVACMKKTRNGSRSLPRAMSLIRNLCHKFDGITHQTIISHRGIPSFLLRFVYSVARLVACFPFFFLFDFGEGVS